MQKAKYWEPTAPQQFEVLLQTCQEATAILGGEADVGIDVDGGFEGLPTGILPYNPCPLPSWEESQSAARAGPQAAERSGANAPSLHPTLPPPPGPPPGTTSALTEHLKRIDELVAKLSARVERLEFSLSLTEGNLKALQEQKQQASEKVPAGFQVPHGSDYLHQKLNPPNNDNSVRPQE